MKNNNAVKIVCNVESVLDRRDLKLKNRHWLVLPYTPLNVADCSRYNFGPQYYRADFDIKAIIGAADLKFQLWGNGGNRLSKDHDGIEVSWNPPQDRDRVGTAAGDEEGAMYQS